MNEAFSKAIAELQLQMKPLEDEIRPVLDQIEAKKKLINQLSVAAGDLPLYLEVEREKPLAIPASVRPDQYFGRPLATVVKEILEPRKGSFGAMALDDLFERLKQGGFQFDNKNEAIAKRNVAITLSKNPAFMKVPNTGAWGLAEWYPGAKRNKPEPAGDKGAKPPESATSSAEGAPESEEVPDTDLAFASDETEKENPRDSV